MILQRATTLMHSPSDLPFAEQYDALPGVSALLSSSLEELRVAEEELRQQNNLLIAQRAAVDERVHHYRQLFLHAPVPAFITDSYGTIREANIAASRLFRREFAQLEQKPLQVLIPVAARENFRRELARVSPEDGVSDWRFVVQRVGDVSIRVSAAVTAVPELGKDGRPLLYWSLRVVTGEP
jgi:PAS domain S-box-containing protein